MYLIPFFALLHLLGALIGTGYTTWAELFYIRAAGDGVIDRYERKYLRRLYRGLHAGMSLIIIASSALIVLEYLIPDAPQAVLTAPFWAIQTLVLVVLLCGQAMSKREAPWWVTSAAVLTGWWMILLSDIGVFNTIGYIPIIMTYLLATVVVAAAVGYARLWTWRPKESKKD